MNAHRLAPRAAARRRRAFTLVELVIVILILGILAGVAAPKLLNVSREAQVAVILGNVDTIFDAAEVFQARNGRLPADAAEGRMPSDFDGLLPERLFTEAESYGGPYKWNGPGGTNTNYGVTLPLTGDSAGMAVYLNIDQSLDDGGPTTGWVRAEAGGTVHFLIDP